MIYRFRAISNDETAFLRDYEIERESNFLELHRLIRENLGFDNTLLASFFLTDEHWNKGMELTLIDMQNDGGMAAIPMDTVKIGDLLKSKRDRLLYVFDIFSERSLFIELIDIFPPDPDTTYPICSTAVGDPPSQVSDSFPSTGFTGKNGDHPDFPFDPYS